MNSYDLVAKVVILVLAVVIAFYHFGKNKAKAQTYSKSQSQESQSGNFVNLDSVEDSIKELLNADYEDMGHIIICANDDEHYVQFAREKCGLMLNCPKAGCWESNLKKAKALLESMGYTDVNKPDAEKEDYDTLKLKEFILHGDDVTGIYANVGDNSTEIRELTATLFKEMFGYRDFDHLSVELVLCNRY